MHTCIHTHNTQTHTYICYIQTHTHTHTYPIYVYHLCHTSRLLLVIDFIPSHAHSNSLCRYLSVGCLLPGYTSAHASHTRIQLTFLMLIRVHAHTLRCRSALHAQQAVQCRRLGVSQRGIYSFLPTKFGFFADLLPVC
jgi:hypothetical protein